MKNRTENRLSFAFQSLTFVRLFRARCPVEDVKYLQRVETHCLTYLTPQLAEIDRAFAIADVGKCSVKSGGG